MGLNFGPCGTGEHMEEKNQVQARLKVGWRPEIETHRIIVLMIRKWRKGVQGLALHPMEKKKKKDSYIMRISDKSPKSSKLSF